MKKLLIIALVVLGSLVAAVPDSKAGVSVGIGIGFPGFVGYPYYGYYPYPVGYYAPVYFGVGYRPYYWWHGHRVYYRRHHYHRWY